MEYTIKNSHLTVRISRMGGELRSVKSAEGLEYLWQGDPKYWGDRAPNIFPYVGRLTKGQYTLNGKAYDMPGHGFVGKSALNVKSQSEDSISLELKSSPVTYQIYPFDFIYRIHYRLQDHTLHISYEVRNESASAMYFGIGGHPGFNVPLENGLAFEDYALEFSRAHTPFRINFTPACFLDGTRTEYPLEENIRIPLAHNLFDQDAIVLAQMDRTVSLKSSKGSRGVTVAYPDMTYLGFWHRPESDAPYVCIEPWASLPSRQDIVEDLSKQPDLISLKSGSEYINNWSITLW